MGKLEDLLEQWSRWLARQRSYQDAPSDWTGQRHMELHTGNVLFLAGTWGVKQSELRTVTVPSGTSVFIVAAFSCATSEELKKPKLHPKAQQGHPLPNPSAGTDPELKTRASNVHKLFSTGGTPTAHLYVDGVLSDWLLTRNVETPPFTVDIEVGNGLASYYGHPGFQRMVSMGDVALLESVASPHKIKIEAKGGKDDWSGEPTYDLEVTYNIEVA